MKEEWKDIPDLPGYQASNLGRIMSLSKTYWTGVGGKADWVTSKDRIIGGKSLSTKGYPRVNILKKVRMVHILVAKTWVSNPFNKPQVNHKDGNKLNNKIDNLEWVTNQENRDHAVKNDLIARRDKNSWNQKLITKQCYEIKNLLSMGMFQREVAKIYNVCQQTICKINKNY